MKTVEGAKGRVSCQRLVVAVSLLGLAGCVSAVTDDEMAANARKPPDSRSSRWPQLLHPRPVRSRGIMWIPPWRQRLARPRLRRSIRQRAARHRVTALPPISPD